MDFERYCSKQTRVFDDRLLSPTSQVNTFGMEKNLIKMKPHNPGQPGEIRLRVAFNIIKSWDHLWAHP